MWFNKWLFILTLQKNQQFSFFLVNISICMCPLYKHIIPTHFSYSIISLKRELKLSHRDTMGQMAKTVFFVFVFLAQMKEWQNIVLNDIIR